MIRSVYIAAIIVLLGSCSLLDSFKAQPIEQSPGDARHYRYLELPNQLRVLLIHDADAPHAAAALNVRAGSSDDPVAYQGLAHFLEHMLFLGTEKYPEVGSYQRFISEHGGSTNAYTSFENTVYFFNVEQQFFGEALDRFADFFVSPLLDPDYVAREINSVESEFRSGLGDPGRQVVEAMQQMFAAGHPMSKLPVGNLQTLQTEGVMDQLKRFYQQHYVAGQMTLAVVSSHELEFLEEMVRQYFTPVRSGKALAKKPALPPLFATQRVALGATGNRPTLPELLVVKTDKPLRQLQLIFPLPDLREHFRTKPTDYIAEVLGDEGPGSAVRLLKQQGLVESLWAGVGLHFHGGALFTINATVTEQGLDNPQRIAAAIFAIRNRLMEELEQRPVAAQQRFDQLGQLAATEFRFYPERPPQSQVLSAAANLHYYPAGKVLSASYDFSQYQASVIREMLGAIVPGNMLMIIGSDSAVEKFALNKRTHWYQADYAHGEIPAEWRESWTDDRLSINPINNLLELPRPSPFLPSHFLLVPNDNIPADFDRGPELRISTEGIEIWQQVDTSFSQPRANMRFSFFSNMDAQSPRDRAIASIYVKLLNDSIERFTYPAARAGLYARFGLGLRGIKLSLSGYSEPLPKLLGATLAAIPELDIAEADFALVKAELARQWGRASAAVAYQRLSDHLSSLLHAADWDYAELSAQLTGIELADLKAFAETVWRDSFALALLHGNVETQLAEQIAGQLAQLGLCECKRSARDAMSVYRLPEGQSFSAVSANHEDAAALWYFQSPADTLHDRAAAWLTAQVFHPLFYAQLRTEQQLGYVVAAQPYMAHRWPGLILKVQSPSHTETELYQTMQHFLLDFLAAPPEQPVFEQYRDNFVAQLARPDTNLPARSGRYWRSLLEGEEGFDLEQRLIAELQALRYQDWLDYLTQLFSANRHALLLVTDHQPLQLPGGLESGHLTAQQLKRIRY